MITGYNTDVEYEGVVYHVQTEDKGLETPIVLSLVYSGGAILAAKRSSYEDLVAGGFEEAALAERLKRQHRLICAAIHAGRVEELRQLSKPQTGRLVMEAVEHTDKAGSGPADSMVAQPTDGETIAEISIDAAMEPHPAPRTGPAQASPVPTPPAATVTESLITPDEGLPVSPSPTTTGPSPYTVYDSRRRSRLGEIIHEPDGLKITLLGHEPDFHGGESLQLQAIVTRISNAVEEPLGGATISVKILGTTFRPVLLSLKTDREGLMSVSTRIPRFTSGRAAIVVRATARDLSTEARWVVHPGK